MRELKGYLHPSGMTLRPVSVEGGVYVQWACGYSEAEEKARARWNRFQRASPLTRRDSTGWRYESVQNCRKVIKLFLRSEAR